MWLNYQHLHYFWTVAHAGSLTAGARRLRLAPSTVSAQVRALGEAFESPLFERRSRKLILTELGEVVLAYANDIFALGEELVDATRHQLGPRHVHRFRIGVGNNLPKLVAHRLLAPAFRVEDYPIHLVCVQDSAENLVREVSAHHLDLVLTDQAVGLASDERVESRMLLESKVSLMGTHALAARYLVDFPNGLEDAPLLLPDGGTTMRRLVEEYFQALGVRPRVVGDFGDSALLKSFGQEGLGLFPVPSLVADEVANQYRVIEVGQLETVVERFHAVFLPGRESNPAVAAILDAVHLP